MGEYLALGIKPEKLVLGLPWYGYDYPCIELTDDRICSIKHVPFRGVNCSDAAGRQIEYAEIEDLVVSRATVGPQWDEDTASYFFNYEDSVGGKHQVWYDNPYKPFSAANLYLALRLYGLSYQTWCFPPTLSS